MFNKKKCKNCDSKIDSNYSFCPHCGFSIKKSTGWTVQLCVQDKQVYNRCTWTKENKYKCRTETVCSKCWFCTYSVNGYVLLYRINQCGIFTGRNISLFYNT